MKKVSIFLVAAVLLFGFAGVSNASPPTYPLNLNDYFVLSWASSGGPSDDWSFICEYGNYQAWFGFYIPEIPPDSFFDVFFTVNLYTYPDMNPADRTLWYAANDAWILVGDDNPGNDNAGMGVGPAPLDTITQTADDLWEFFTFNFILSSAELEDHYLTLMLTGPEDGSHLCGLVDLTLEGSAVPIPGAVWLLGSGLLGLAGFRKKLLN